MPKFVICSPKSKNFENGETLKTESPTAKTLDAPKSLFLSQLELAETYLSRKLKESARLALLIVRELWTVEKPEKEKERYNAAVRALKQL